MTLVYSTGPMENAVANASQTVTAKAVHNGVDGKVKVLWLAFSLDGSKRLIDSALVVVGPQGVGQAGLNVAGTVQFEIEAQLSGLEPEEVLLGVFGLDAEGHLNPAHRLVHSELTLIDDGIEAEVALTDEAQL